MRGAHKARAMATLVVRNLSDRPLIEVNKKGNGAKLTNSIQISRGTLKAGERREKIERINKGRCHGTYGRTKRGKGLKEAQGARQSTKTSPREPDPSRSHEIGQDPPKAREIKRKRASKRERSQRQESGRKDERDEPWNTRGDKGKAKNETESREIRRDQPRYSEIGPRKANG